MQADDYKFYVSVFVDSREVSAKEIFYCDYQTALDAAASIVDAEFDCEKNIYCHVWILLVAILYYPNGEIKDRWSEKAVYSKYIQGGKR